MGSYNSNCYDNDCSDDCCNGYGYCPNYTSTDPWANQCFYYYDQIRWINWFFFWLGLFVFCIIIAVICIIIKRRNNRQQTVIDYGAGSGHQYNQYVPPNQQNYQQGQYFGQPNYHQQVQPYHQNQPVGYQGQYYGNNYNANNSWQGQNNQPIVG